jgi:hypothetical protein
MRGAQQGCEHLGHFGLSDPGLPFEEERSAHLEGEVDGDREASISDVLGVGERGDDLVHGRGEHGATLPAEGPIPHPGNLRPCSDSPSSDGRTSQKPPPGSTAGGLLIDVREQAEWDEAHPRSGASAHHHDQRLVAGSSRRPRHRLPVPQRQPLRPSGARLTTPGWMQRVESRRWHRGLGERRRTRRLRTHRDG